MAFVTKQERNPNRDGVCLCSVGRDRGTDCSPPYLVWQTQELDDPMNPFPVLCAGCPHVQQALEGEALASVEGDGTVVEDEPTADFSDLPAEEQASLQASFAAGSLTRIPTGDLVLIPEEATGTLESLRGALAPGA